MRYILIFLILICLLDSAFAQFNSIQYPHLDKYDLKNFNPAGAAIDNEQVFSLNYQGTGFRYDDHPALMYLSYENFIKKLNSGIAINIIHDQLGVLKTNQIDLTYNYRLNFESNNFINIGAELSRILESLDSYYYRYNQGGDLLIDVDYESVHYEHSFGIYYQNKMNGIGVSLHNLFENSNNHWLLGNKRRTLKIFGTNLLPINEGLQLYSMLGYQSDFDVWLINFDNTIEVKSMLLGVNFIKSKNDDLVFSFDAGYDLNKFFQFNVLYQPKKENEYTALLEIMARIKIKN